LKAPQVCPTLKPRKTLKLSKWLTLNGELARKKLVKCSKVTELRKLGKSVYKESCKWEKQIRKIALVGEMGGV
jgi:hypothetical protein